MIRKNEVLRIIEEMGHVTGNRISNGFNAFLEAAVSFEQDGDDVQLVIDPSCFTSEGFSALIDYASTHHLQIGEKWNDWGRFLVLS
jgi:hypothetical protein